MYPKVQQPVQSPALSFRTRSRTTTSQRHLGRFWSTDGSLIGFLRVVVFAASHLLFTVRFRLPTIIRYPSMWLLSSAMSLRPFAVPRYAARLFDCGPNLQALFGNVLRCSEQSAIASWSQYLVDRKACEEKNVIALTRLVSRSQLRRYRQISAMNSELQDSRRTRRAT